MPTSQTRSTRSRPRQVSPTDPDTILATTEEGLARVGDGGRAVRLRD